MSAAELDRERPGSLHDSLRAEGSHECIFCGIIEGKRPSNEIARSEQAIAVLAIEGHPLVMPIRHLTTEEVERGEGSKEMAGMYALVTKIIPGMEEAYGATGVNVVTNLGADAGQEIPHIHTHILPRRPNDGGMRVRIGFRPKRRDYPRIVEAIQRRISAV